MVVLSQWELLAAVIFVVIMLGFFVGKLVYNKITAYKKTAHTWKEKYTKVLSQKKSSEVRLGKIGENLAPFTDAWPYDPKNFIFLGREVDGLQINENEVVFVEIKTGKARLTKSQKRIKELVKEGKVYFETFRVGEDGCVVTRTKNDS